MQRTGLNEESVAGSAARIASETHRALSLEPAALENPRSYGPRTPAMGRYRDRIEAISLDASDGRDYFEPIRRALDEEQCASIGISERAPFFLAAIILEVPVFIGIQV